VVGLYTKERFDMPTPKWKRDKIRELAHHFREILKILDYSLKDRNLKDTPKRVAKSWFEELYRQPPKKELFAVFPEQHDQMIVLLHHEAWTRCPHHLERVRLNVSIGYIPERYVLGVSKLARIANFYAQGLTLQESYAEALAEGIYNALNPRGVGVYVEGIHHCMCARGVKTKGKVITTSLRGVFFEDIRTREEFLKYVKGG